MGWTETCAMDERMRFVLAVEKRRGVDGGVVPALRGEPAESATSGWRATGRKGLAGLLDRSRAPLHHPQAMCGGHGRALPCGAAGASDLGAGEGAGLSGAARRRSAAWPAASTIGALFDREGLTVKRRLRRRSSAVELRRSPPCGAANDVWASTSRAGS